MRGNCADGEAASTEGAVGGELAAATTLIDSMSVLLAGFESVDVVDTVAVLVA